MTVKELIEELEKIEDKSQEVECPIHGETGIVDEIFEIDGRIVICWRRMKNDKSRSNRTVWICNRFD